MIAGMTEIEDMTRETAACEIRRLSFEARDAVRSRLIEAEQAGDAAMMTQWRNMLDELRKTFEEHGWERHPQFGAR